MKKTLLWGLLLTGILLVIISMVLLYQISKPFTIKTLETHVHVSDRLGINLDTDKLYFGTMLAGNKGGRHINITSDRDAYVVISKEGSMADWLYPEKNGFLMEKGTVDSVFFVVNPPPTASFGNYTGKIILKFYTPLMASFMD